MVAMDTGLEQLCLFLQMANTHFWDPLTKPFPPPASSQFQSQEVSLTQRAHFTFPLQLSSSLLPLGVHQTSEGGNGGMLCSFLSYLIFQVDNQGQDLQSLRQKGMTSGIVLKWHVCSSSGTIIWVTIWWKLWASEARGGASQEMCISLNVSLCGEWWHSRKSC